MKVANIRLLTVKNVELRTDVLPGAIWELALLRLHWKPCLKQPGKGVQKGNLRGSENNYLGTVLWRNWKKSQSLKEMEKKSQRRRKNITSQKRRQLQRGVINNIILC